MVTKKNHEVTVDQNRQKQLRLWPGVVIVIVQWLLRFVVPVVIPGAISIMAGIFGGLLGGLLIIVWWFFFSRAPRIERWGAVILMIVVLATTSLLLHESIATAQAGMTFPIYAVPVLSLAFVLWAVVSRHLSVRLRRILMVTTILLACGAWALFRTVGMTADIGHKFTWRWLKTAEEQLLDGGKVDTAVVPSVSMDIKTGPGWPGFRGSSRDGILNGVRIKTDWAASPPKELWRRPVGPGFSSCAIHGNLFFTQEQRGEDEVVACYKLANGEAMWKYYDKVRFLGADAHPGPRATPAVSNGRVYSCGATGILNVLEVADGSLIWSRNLVTDTKIKVPIWGFASSPLVTDNAVYIAAAGMLVAYSLNGGEPIWTGPDGGESYSSPHLVTISGVSQLLLQSGAGLIGIAPADGKVLWKHSWSGGTRIVQPALTTYGDLLISDGNGMCRIRIKKETSGWTSQELWASKGLKPEFNDFVIHKGHVYGFDGQRLACINLEGGARKWKGGRYGGQMLLLAEQDLLLLITEKGDLALVKAIPDHFTEMIRIPAIKGKTWNHPVLAGDLLLVRNAREMAAFKLFLEESASSDD